VVGPTGIAHCPKLGYNFNPAPGSWTTEIKVVLLIYYPTESCG